QRRRPKRPSSQDKEAIAMARLMLQPEGSPKSTARISENKPKEEMPAQETKPEPMTATLTPPMAEAVASLHVQDWAGVGNIAMNTLLKANNVMMNGMVAWGQEVMSFTQTRMNEVATQSEALRQCTDAAAAFNVHRDFAMRAATQYME